MENQKKKDVIEPNHMKKEIDADAADTLIRPLDELDLEPPPLDEMGSDES
jgi:hypothetical protein